MARCQGPQTMRVTRRSTHLRQPVLSTVEEQVSAAPGHGRKARPAAGLPALARRQRPHPDVLAAWRRERARVRSERRQTLRPKTQAASRMTTPSNVSRRRLFAASGTDPGHLVADQFRDHGRRPQRQQMVGTRPGDLLAARNPRGDVCCAARHHRVLVISGDHCGWELDLAEPAVGRRVGSLVIAEPEVSLCCAADLGLRRHRRRPRSAGRERQSRPRSSAAESSSNCLP